MEPPFASLLKKHRGFLVPDRLRHFDVGLAAFAWAPNSMKVAIVEDEARGSVVLGAWTDERSIPADMASDPEFLKGPSDVVGRPATWHKTIRREVDGFLSESAVAILH